jgi:hypothetical protein
MLAARVVRLSIKAPLLTDGFLILRCERVPFRVVRLAANDVRTVAVDTFRAPMRQLRRLNEAIERGPVDVQARPTGTAPARPFPFILVLCGLGLLAGVLIFVPLPDLGSLLGDDEVDQASATSSTTVPNGWVTCRFGHVTVWTPPLGRRGR